ncbi:MAG: helix-turn-helix transcriptional regulator [Enhydrobacter sp.]|nr:helix-turn-helix transcriptional regulator [Parvibaculum sp.]MCW5738292.1 helix-turn-helix transcriptional regulator [Enhydrobacter sp.]
MGLGPKIRQLRTDRDQSLQQVADAVGVSKAHICELEKERADNPSIALVTRLADHFNVSIRYLIDEDMNAPDVDDVIARICRLARNLHVHEVALLDDMVTSMLKHKASVSEGTQAV